MDKLVKVSLSKVFCQSSLFNQIFRSASTSGQFKNLFFKQNREACGHLETLALPLTQFQAKYSQEVIEDYNEKALKELDITLLKPHPEWRNVAAGPVWGKKDEVFEGFWKEWLDEPFVKKMRAIQDKEWDEYVENFSQTPVEYLKSEDYADLYGEKETWINYFRNRKGFIQHQNTRRSCYRKGVMATGSPCPLCRDNRLLLTYKNIPLLIQYIDQHTGELHSELRTGLCQEKKARVVLTFKLAKELGYFHCNVPYVKYDLKQSVINSYVT